VTSESAHSLTAGNLNGDLQVSLRPGSPQPFPGPPGPAGTQWLPRAASTAWGLLSGFAGLLMPASAWIAMFLASRMGAFGACDLRHTISKCQSTDPTAPPGLTGDDEWRS
jgi:hypothetical protein